MEIKVKKLATVLWTLMVFSLQPAAGQFVPQDGERSLNPVEKIKFNSVYPSPYRNTELGVFSGPYMGTLFDNPSSITGPQITLYCVDKLHSVNSSVPAWEVDVTSLDGTGAMTNTRLGDVSGSLFRYRQAAYLASMFSTTYASSPENWDAVHAAIWKITSGYSAGSHELSLITSLVTQSQEAVEAGFTGHGWYVMTDRSAGNLMDATGGLVSSNYVGGTQEFLVRTVAPEPETYVLLLSGLVAILFVARRRLKENGYA
jgi:hypothetical protein